MLDKAITPQEIVNEQKDLIYRFVNEQLKERFIGTGTVEISFNRISIQGKLLRRANFSSNFIADYNAAGWTVVITEVDATPSSPAIVLVTMSKT